MHSSTPSVNGSDITEIRPRQALKAQKSYVAQMSMVPTPATLPSLPVCTNGLLGSSLRSVDRGREDRPDSHVILQDTQALPESGQLQPCSPLQENTVKGDPPSGRTWSSAPGRALCLEGQVARPAVVY